MADDIEVIDALSDPEDEVVAMDGFLEFSHKANKDFKAFYFILTGSTLYYYKTERDAEPKGSFELAECTAKQEKMDVVLHLGSQYKEKERDLYLRTSREDKAKLWLEAIEQQKSQPARPAPERETHTEHKSLGYRAQKLFGSKFAGSKAGASALTSVDEAVEKLTQALKNLIQTQDGKEKAEDIHKGISKLLVKALIEWRRDMIKPKDLRAMDAPMRDAFNRFDKLFQLYQRRKAADMRGEFEAACGKLSETVDKVSELMRPFLTAKNMMLIQKIGDYLCNPEFWINIWDNEDKDKQIEPALFELVHAMSKYTQIELPDDD